MIKKIAVIGLGNVGSLVARLLSKSYEVYGVDKEASEDISFLASFESIDVSNVSSLRRTLEKVDGVVSCLTFHLNRQVVKIALDMGVHYFDLSEDRATTKSIIQLVKNKEVVAIPQCGLAPGYIGIVGYDLVKKFAQPQKVMLRVGALPSTPNNSLGYACNWSPSGVVNEYINDSEVIHNGVKKNVPSLQNLETLFIRGKKFEASTTSGGLGTLCDTLENKVDTLNYKSIRYPQHTQLMNFLLYELNLKHDRKRIVNILSEALPPVSDDIVIVYATVEGINHKKKLVREEFCHTYLPLKIDNKIWRAISWTTAASVVAVIELFNSGKTPQKGFVRQEDILLEDFLKTPTGQLFNTNLATKS